MKTRILAGLIALAVPFGINAATDSDDTLHEVDVPQVFALANPTNPSKGLSADVLQTVWLVTSNNGFDINFTGASFDDTGGALTYPHFVKKDVKADGTAHTNRYDNLDTTFGITITDHDSVETTDTWGGGAVPVGTGTDLVKGLTVASGPDATIGTIMPDDDDSEATINLYSSGILSTHDQSGDYSATITITATTDEKEL